MDISPQQIKVLSKEDQAPKIIAIVVSFTVLTFLFVALRIFTRLKYTGYVGLEDYFIGLSMIFTILMAACQVLQAERGNGRHMIFLDTVDGMWILKYLYFSILAYCVSLTLTKVSILLQYRRIFCIQQARSPIYIVMGFCVAYGFMTVLFATFACIPVDAFWDLKKKPNARCVDVNLMYYINAGLNVATDLLIAALPVKVIWSLQIVRRQKIALIFVLTLGWFVCIVSIVRLHALIQLAKHPDDSSWYGAATAYWSALEVNLAIVCASTPALKPLIVKFLPVFGSRHGSQENSNMILGNITNTSRSSKLKISFMRFKGKYSSSVSANAELQSGTNGNPPTPPPPSYNPNTNSIHVTQDFELTSVRDSENGSQYSLVPVDSSSLP